MPTHAGFVTSTISGTVVNGDNLNFGFTSPQAQGELVIAGQFPIATGIAFPGVQIRSGSLTSPLGTITIGYAAPNITLDVVGGLAPIEEIAVQAVTAPGVSPVLPIAGLVTLNGATVAAQAIPVQSRSLALHSLQIEVQRASSSVATNATQQGLSSYNSAQFSVDANGFVSEINGLPAANFPVQAFTAPGVSPVLPSALGAVTINGTTVAAHSIPLRSDSLALNTINIEAQRTSATAVTDATSQGFASFNSAHFSVDANGFVSDLNGLPISEVTVQAFTAPGVSPVLPSALGNMTISGSIVAAHAIPLQTDSLALNAYNVEAQFASQQAVSSGTNAGMASFNSAHFLVDASGFVSDLNGVPITKIGVDAFLAPGTNPTLPSAAGLLTITGGQVPAGTTTNVIRTDSLAANTFTVEVQRSSAQAVSTIGANGVCHFDSADFTVDANGFVSSISGVSPWLDSAGGALVNLTGYFATAAAVYTLPAGVMNGDMVEIVDFVGGGVVVTAQGGDAIRISNTTSSVNGTATTTQIGDAVRLVYRLVPKIWVCVPGASGNWILA